MKRQVFLPIAVGVTAGVGVFPHMTAPEPVEPVVIVDNITVEPTFPPALPLSPLPSEDDPDWDCRTMGNRTCGVEIEGTWYLVTFENGVPVGVSER